MEFFKIKNDKYIHLEKVKKHYCFTKDTLYTKKELENLQGKTNKNLYNFLDYEVVTICKNKTFMFFGNRKIKK